MSMACEQVGLDKPEELSLSELQRKLYKELKCPICLDLIKNTMTTEECLHRFCSDCIIKSLQSNNKECPVCGNKIESKRNLRPDPNFDKLVKIIFPSGNEYKAFQEGVMDGIAAKKSRMALASSDLLESLTKNEVELILMARTASNLTDTCVNISKNAARYLKVFDHATIDHLKKYLAMRLNLDSLDPGTSNNADFMEFLVYVASNGQFVLLNGNSTLKEVIDTYWKANKPLELYYAIAENS